MKSFCQGLVDGGIDSCKDTRALGWGKGQPCITASEVVLLERGARVPAPPSPGACLGHNGCLDLCPYISRGAVKPCHVRHFLLNLPHQPYLAEEGLLPRVGGPQKRVAYTEVTG